MRRCKMSRADQVAEVVSAMEKVNRDNKAVWSLYAHGSFRHKEDVAYAIIMVNAFGETEEEVSSYLKSEYRTLNCNPVTPPS